MGLVMRYKIFQFPERQRNKEGHGDDTSAALLSQASIQEFSDYHGDGKFQ